MLYEFELKSLLKNYGDVMISGSYMLDVMVWRDLDLFVDVSKIKQQDIYDISTQIFRTYQPSWFETRNTFNEDSGCPKGYFLGFETSIIKNQLWNVDIWFTNLNYINDHRSYINNLNMRLTNDLRKYITNIKNKLIETSLYGEKVYSIDVYKAVIDHQVKSFDDFKNWMKNSKRMVIL